MPKNLSQLREDLLSHLDEPVARSYTNTELDRWINEGQVDICRRAEVYQSTATGSISAGVATLALPSDVIRVHRIEYTVGGQIYTVTPSTMNEMDQYWGTNHAQQGTYPMFFVMWGVTPNLTLRWFPVPSSTATYTLYYYALPVTMTSDSDVLSIPEGWDDLVILYAEVNCLRRSRDARWQEAKTLYEARLLDMIDVTRQWHDQSRFVQSRTQMVPAWLYGYED